MAEIKPAQLHGAWVHSHEEDTPGRTVYRPRGYDFPPSRGRRGFELRPDGTLAETSPGPADRPAEASGTWKLRPGGELVLIPDAEGQSPRVLAVVAAEPDRLVVRKGE